MFQSAAMFAVKIADMVGMKHRWEEHLRLEAEHALLIDELETALSPENAEQVAKILTKHENRRSTIRRASFGVDTLAQTLPDSGILRVQSAYTEGEGREVDQ